MKPEEETIELLSRAIIKEAEEDAQQAQADAKAKAEAIRQRAQQQAEKEREEILNRARQEAERLKGQVVASAQLKARTLQLEHREKLLDRVFDAARQKLSAIQKRADFDKIAAQLLREALVQLNADKVAARADEVTQKALERALPELSKELNAQVSFGPPLEEGIGIVVDASEGHLHYDNTLKTRLDRLQSVLRSSVYHVLMGEKL